MTTCIRRQQRYDHRLRELVLRTGELRLATGRGVPRSTARGWLGASSSAVVSLDGADRTEAELRQKILMLQRRVTKLAALLGLRSSWVHAASVRSPASGSLTVPARRDC